jgi:hypothetical protein
MIKLTGAAVLVLAFAAVAQAGGGNSAHFTAWPSPDVQVGSGGTGGGEMRGSGTLMHVAPARFAVREVSGNASDYIPSTFVSYNSAVAEGEASQAARPQPLKASTQESGKAAPKNSKTQIVQKKDGALAIQP